MANYDILGNIAIMKFDKKTSKKQKLREVKRLLKRKDVKTVLEKTDKVSGRLRTIKTRFIAGIKTKEAVYKENGCKFKLNVETCYFSPRLAEERKQIALRIKKKNKVLVMFSGVNPFGIVIAKKTGASVVSVELGKDCNRYAKENSKINKLSNKIQIIQGDVKNKVTGKLGKFDVIVMPRPNLKETFLKQAFSVSKKGTMIYYYCFGHEDKLGKLVEEVYREARKSKKKIKIIKIKKAGEIAPYKFRYRVEIKVG